MENKTKLSPPWVTYYKELNKFFEGDPEVKVIYDDTEDEIVIKILVDNTDKADALSMILKPSVDFGNVHVNIDVCPPNNSGKTMSELMKIALKGNSSCVKIQTVTDVFGNKINYAVFNKEVAQFFNDDISDPNGFKTMLYSQIAEDIFKEHGGVFFSTASESIWRYEINSVSWQMNGKSNGV